MGLLRPELAARLHRRRELLAAAVTFLAGAWVFHLGGLFYRPLGCALAGFALLWGLDAWRRRGFDREIAAPGVVEIDEGAVRYFGARLMEGELPLRELQEIRLLRLDGRTHWRLRTVDQAMLIPLDAAGAAALPAGFAALPGFDLAQAAAALHSNLPAAVVWRRA